MEELRVFISMSEIHVFIRHLIGNKASDFGLVFGLQHLSSMEKLRLIPSISILVLLFLA